MTTQGEQKKVSTSGRTRAKASERLDDRRGGRRSRQTAAAVTTTTTTAAAAVAVFLSFAVAQVSARLQIHTRAIAGGGGGGAATAMAMAMASGWRQADDLHVPSARACAFARALATRHSLVCARARRNEQIKKATVKRQEKIDG